MTSSQFKCSMTTPYKEGSLGLGSVPQSEGSAELTYSVIEITGVREITYMIFRWLDIIVNDLHLICSVISVVHIRNWVFILMSWATETAGSRSSRQAKVAAAAAASLGFTDAAAPVGRGPQQRKVGCCCWSAGVAAAGRSSSSQTEVSVVVQPQQREVGAADLGRGGHGTDCRDYS